MKTILVIACFIACAFAADKLKDYKDIPIVAQENVVEHDGKFHYSFETGDGTKAVQDGELKHIDPENAGEAVKGAFSYEGDDGHQYSITYTADEHGYVPHGDHLPVAPPVPAAIARALAYLATLPPPKDEKKH